MKQLQKLLLLIAIFVAGANTAAFAADEYTTVTDNGIEYRIYDGRAYVSKLVCTDGESCVIPETITISEKDKFGLSTTEEYKVCGMIEDAEFDPNIKKLDFSLFGWYWSDDIHPSLSQTDDNNNVEELVVKNLYIQRNDLFTIVISGFKKLKSITTDGICKSVIVKSLPELETFNVGGYVSYLTIENCPKLVELSGAAYFDKLTISNCAKLTTITTTGDFNSTTLNATLTNLPSMTSLAFNNKMDSLKLTRLTNLEAITFNKACTSLKFDANTNKLNSIYYLADTEAPAKFAEDTPVNVLLNTTLYVNCDWGTAEWIAKHKDETYASSYGWYYRYFKDIVGAVSENSKMFNLVVTTNALSTGKRFAIVATAQIEFGRNLNVSLGNPLTSYYSTTKEFTSNATNFGVAIGIPAGYDFNLYLDDKQLTKAADKDGEGVKEGTAYYTVDYTNSPYTNVEKNGTVAYVWIPKPAVGEPNQHVVTLAVKEPVITYDLNEDGKVDVEDVNMLVDEICKQ